VSNEPQETPESDAPGREEAVPLSRMRQAIGRAMVASLQTTARSWNVADVNMEPIARLRDAAKDAFVEREGVPLTYMPFVARATCEALLAFPDVNAELRGDQLIRKRYVNLGIAVALETGLLVPNVKEAHTLGLVELAHAMDDLVARARGKKLVPGDVQGGTFTITNPGAGCLTGLPIVNPPECAILAFGSVDRRPAVEGDAIVIQRRSYVSMSWDHRIIDGLTAARFLAQVKQGLEQSDFAAELTRD
jgi:pyruvate dehydrogenase E2 component (dihydrolipoamide acetyltransferase)